MIAELVKNNLIKFIITTNFDSLLEYALDDIGLKGQYNIISNDDDVKNNKPDDTLDFEYPLCFNCLIFLYIILFTIFSLEF